MVDGKPASASGDAWSPQSKSFLLQRNLTCFSISKIYIDQAQNKIKERGHDVPEEDKSIIEKLIAIDERVAILMANEMLMAGIDTVSYTPIT